MHRRPSHVLTGLLSTSLLLTSCANPAAKSHLAEPDAAALELSTAPIKKLSDDELYRITKITTTQYQNWLTRYQMAVTVCLADTNHTGLTYDWKTHRPSDAEFYFVPLSDDPTTPNRVHLRARQPLEQSIQKDQLGPKLFGSGKWTARRFNAAGCEQKVAAQVFGSTQAATAFGKAYVALLSEATSIIKRRGKHQELAQKFPQCFPGDTAFPVEVFMPASRFTAQVDRTVADVATAPVHKCAADAAFWAQVRALHIYGFSAVVERDPQLVAHIVAGKERVLAWVSADS